MRNKPNPDEPDWPHILTWLLLGAVLVFLFIIASDACYQHDATGKDIEWLEGDIERVQDWILKLRSLVYERCIPGR